MLEFRHPLQLHFNRLISFSVLEEERTRNMPLRNPTHHHPKWEGWAAKGPNHQIIEHSTAYCGWRSKPHQLLFLLDFELIFLKPCWFVLCSVDGSNKVRIIFLFQQTNIWQSVIINLIKRFLDQAWTIFCQVRLRPRTGKSNCGSTYCFSKFVFQIVLKMMVFSNENLSTLTATYTMLAEYYLTNITASTFVIPQARQKVVMIYIYRYYKIYFAILLYPCYGTIAALLM